MVYPPETPGAPGVYRLPSWFADQAVLFLPGVM